uniref:Uncharacterized protein n=1 Tax=Oryza barthii TaxID=65489 RepID=A0A0D3HV05_9ORYZ
MTKTTTMTGLEGGGSITATIGRGGSIVLGLGAMTTGSGDSEAQGWRIEHRIHREGWIHHPWPWER